MSKASSSKEFNGKGTDSISTFPLLKRILAVVVALLAIGTMLYPIEVLKASDSRSGEYLSSWWPREDKSFTIKYIHSVERTPVWEMYTIEEGEIVLEETVFQSYGAGLPATSPYDFDIVEEGFRLYNIDQKMTNLVYRTGAVRANHELTVGGRTYLFVEFSEPTEGVKFETQKTPIIVYLAKEGFK
ncbi:MAG: DUF1850 domain-containing protein [Gudongella sp.]|nr:DUF1850 domain-containing protein [Gudongella sp.]